MTRTRKLITIGAEANSVERDGENGATWEVELTRADGKTVDVRLDEAHELVIVEGDQEDGNDAGQLSFLGRLVRPPARLARPAVANVPHAPYRGALWTFAATNVSAPVERATSHPGSRGLGLSAVSR